MWAVCEKIKVTWGNSATCKCVGTKFVKKTLKYTKYTTQKKLGTPQM